MRPALHREFPERRQPLWTFGLRLTAALFALVVGWSAIGTSVSAMEFVVRTDDDGLKIVVARGLIAAGDTERFRQVLGAAERDRFGNKRVALVGDGGLVGEAFGMAELMESEKVSAVIMPGSACSSACATIVFLGGVHRYVLDRGRLGLHTCTVGKTKSAPCNELIARRAERRGVPYQRFAAFLERADPAKTKWLTSEEADCWGLTRWPPGRGPTPSAGNCPTNDQVASLTLTH
ncbi:MAG: hypothetical protein U1E60_00450 [Reyranellaceae bacterium]